MDNKYALELMSKVEKILDELDRDSELFKYEEIDWDHLRVSDVAYVDSYAHGKYTMVLIDGASPACIQLQARVIKKLMGAGIDRFTVITQW